MEASDWQVGLDAALVALSGRIRLSESCTRTPEEIVTELYVREFGTKDAPKGEDPEDGGGPGEA
ncbi:MAG: hypothetical protein ABI083_07600 [Lapillicoccus sp.]